MYPRSRCVCAIVALLALACLVGVSAADGWHQFQKDALNTGITSDAAPRSDPELVSRTTMAMERYLLQWQVGVSYSTDVLLFCDIETFK